MPSISDRLKALGVNIGGSDLAKKTRKANFPVETVVNGQLVDSPFGDAFVVDQRFPIGHMHGARALNFPKSIDRLAIWARDFSLGDRDPGSFLFLDTETTGLSGASGTFAFLIGVGRFHEGEFWQRQFFLRDPIEEAAMLAALEIFAAPSDALVTFNGKSFDLPLVNTRYLSNAAPSPFTEMAHIDLLHLARRLWRDVLPNRSLGDLESAFLGIQRTSEDIPGWMIPEIYIDYLRSGDARPLGGVFYHNALDILSMVTLLDMLAGKLEQPFDKQAPPAELFAIARLFADLGLPEDAISLYEKILDLKLSKDLRQALIENLAWLYRRKEDFESATDLWELAAKDDEIYAHVEMAKFHEHKNTDFKRARSYTEKAIKIMESSKTARYDRLHWRPLLEHRLERIIRKQMARKKK